MNSNKALLAILLVLVAFIVVLSVLVLKSGVKSTPTPTSLTNTTQTPSTAVNSLTNTISPPIPSSQSQVQLVSDSSTLKVVGYKAGVVSTALNIVNFFTRSYYHASTTQVKLAQPTHLIIHITDKPQLYNLVYDPIRKDSRGKPAVFMSSGDSYNSTYQTFHLYLYLNKDAANVSSNENISSNLWYYFLQTVWYATHQQPMVEEQSFYPKQLGPLEGFDIQKA